MASVDQKESTGASRRISERWRRAGELAVGSVLKMRIPARVELPARIAGPTEQISWSYCHQRAKMAERLRDEFAALAASSLRLHWYDRWKHAHFSRLTMELGDFGDVDPLAFFRVASLEPPLFGRSRIVFLEGFLSSDGHKQLDRLIFKIAPDIADFKVAQVRDLIRVAGLQCIEQASRSEGPGAIDLVDAAFRAELFFEGELMFKRGAEYGRKNVDTSSIAPEVVLEAIRRGARAGGLKSAERRRQSAIEPAAVVAAAQSLGWPQNTAGVNKRLATRFDCTPERIGQILRSAK